MEEPPNFYHVLGISRLASPGQVRAAYIRLLKQHHPDHSSRYRSSSQLHQVQRAYRCLRDPDTRAEHDRLLLIRDASYGRSVRRVRRNIRRLDRRRPAAYGRRPSIFGRTHALLMVSGGTMLLWLLLTR